MTQPAEFLTPVQLVEKLTAAGIKVSEYTVRKWARTHRLSAVRIPPVTGRIFFRTSDVEKFLEPVDPPTKTGVA